jgi:hypothetical protein
LTATNRIVLLLFISLIVASLFWLRTLDSTEYANLSALNAAQKKAGYVPIGRFGKSWPAVVVEEREQDDRIEFKRSNGQPHIYQGFDGYRLKMIRLRSRSGAEVVAVYRSERSNIPTEMERNDKPVIRRL